MKPSERLKDIEYQLYIHSELAPSQLKWLIARAKQLENALGRIAYWKSDANVCCFPVEPYEILDQDPLGPQGSKDD